MVILIKYSSSGDWEKLPKFVKPANSKWEHWPNFPKDEPEGMKKHLRGFIAAHCVFHYFALIENLPFILNQIAPFHAHDEANKHMFSHKPSLAKKRHAGSRDRLDKNLKKKKRSHGSANASLKKAMNSPPCMELASHDAGTSSIEKGIAGKKKPLKIAELVMRVK